MSKAILKSCPFCGGEAEILTFANPKYMVSVKCQSCPGEISGWRFTDTDKNVNITAVVGAWNQRIEARKESPLEADKINDNLSISYPARQVIEVLSQWLQDNGFKEASKAIDCEFEL